jgi:hypothetical protein
VATPSISRWTSVRLPLNTTIPQAPLRSRTAGFPRSGSDLGFPSWAFPIPQRSSSTDIRTPRSRWFTHKLVPRCESGLVLGSASEGHSGAAKCPEPLCCTSALPMCRRRRASPRRTLLPLHRSYGLMRRTAALLSPPASPSCSRSLQVAVSPCCATLLPDVISTDPSPRVWTSTPAAPEVHVPVTSPRTMAFPKLGTGRRVAVIPTATSVGERFSELQSFTNVQTHKSCSPHR